MCLETSFLWRHRFLAAAGDKRPSALTGIVEADETFILKPAKGSRKLIGRVVAKDALLVTDGRAAYAQLADAAGILHIALNASAGERSFGSYHIRTRQCLPEPYA